MKKNSTTDIIAGVIGLLLTLFVYSNSWDAQTGLFGFGVWILSLIFLIPATAHLITQKERSARIWGVIFLLVIFGPIIYLILPDLISG